VTFKVNLWLMVMLGAVVFAGGCGDSGSGQAGPIKTASGQSTIEQERTVAKDQPSPTVPR
jgi:hypothetical protein